MDFTKSLHVVIVGGSLASLFSAIPILHQRANHRVTILERSPTPLLHDQGAGIVAGAEALQWLRRFGGDGGNVDVEDISVSSGERLYLDLQGKVIDREASEQRMTSWGVVNRIGRREFEKFGGEGEGEKGSARATYAYGCRVTGMKQVDGRVRVDYVEAKDGEGPRDSEIMADFVVVADGPSSHTRKTLLGNAGVDEGQRKYAGYVAFRGTVSEKEISPAARDVFVQRFTFFHGHEPNTLILAYTIPGQDGTVKEGERLVNWVWYWNIEEDSPEYEELMTDKDGARHRFTLPTGGKMQKHVWERQLDVARRYLPPQFVEVIVGTNAPFVQAITDLEPPPVETQVGRLLGGRAVLVGDALAGFRPHTAASTSQAAFDALMLEKVFKGEIEWAEYERKVLEFAWSWQKRGVSLGQRSQFGVHPLAVQERGGRNASVGREELWMKKT